MGLVVQNGTTGQSLIRIPYHSPYYDQLYFTLIFRIFANHSNPILYNNHTPTFMMCSRETFISAVSDVLERFAKAHGTCLWKYDM